MYYDYCDLGLSVCIQNPIPTGLDRPSTSTETGLSRAERGKNVLLHYWALLGWTLL